MEEKSGLKELMEPQLSKNSIAVLEKRYFKKDNDGKPIETPKELFWRVASNIASADKKFYGASEEETEALALRFYEAMARCEFMPNSPTLMNAGKALQQLSACFVLPVEDDMAGIFDAIKFTSLIHQCLVPETMVMTNKGLIRLVDVSIGSHIATDGGTFSVVGVHDNGEKAVFRVITAHGYEVTGTPEHRLLVVNEGGLPSWRRIGQLKSGDWLILKPGCWIEGCDKLPEFIFKEKKGRNSTSFKARKYKLPKKITTDLAELIGLYIGDGSNHRDGIRFTVAKNESDLVKRIEDLSKRLFDKKPVISNYKNKSVYEVAILSVQIKQWFDFLGITKKYSREARIPDIILRATRDNIYAFLRGLFTTDGCIRRSGHITLSTASKQLVDELQVLMLYLGIPTRKYLIRKTNVYQLSICNKSGFLVFKEKVGFSTARKQKRLDSVKTEKIFVRGETVPNQRQRLRAWYDSFPRGTKRKAQELFDDILNGIKKPRELSRQRISKAIEKGTFPEFFKEITANNLFYTKVIATEPVGIRRVFDLTVPYKHAYLANGFVSHNSGGGTGFAFSRLRPRGDVVKSTMGVASGPVSFMKVFDSATDVIKQGGSRRGANMGVLSVHHPDIQEFIECKRDMVSITNFNISVAATDDFMRAAAEGSDYDLINPRDKKTTGKLSAKEIFDKIVENAWHNGDPGIIFIDRMNDERTNPTRALAPIESTNPCGEQPLQPYESCNLGSVNLSKMIKHENGAAEVDWDRLERTTKLAVHFLDNVIDMNRYPLPQIEQATRFGNRKIGLGVMGFADMLLELGIPYNSEAAVKTAEKVMAFVSDKANEASAELARSRGPFPNWEQSVFHPDGPRYRNATRTTIAPTGTIAIIAGASSGIEPLFAVSYTRVTPTYKLIETNPIFERTAKDRGFHSKELMEKIASSNSLQDFEEIPDDVKKIFVTAHDITPEWHVRIQAAFQKHTDNAVSKTINFPNSATIEDVKKAYLLAYELGCKGITIYRDGSRVVQVLSTKKKEEKKEPELMLAKPRPRPRAMAGSTREVKTGCGDMYVTINNDKNGPFEVFCGMGKSGGCISAYSEAIGRLASLALRCGVDPKQVIKQLKGIRCSRPVFDTGGITYSCADAVSKTISDHISPDKSVQAGIVAFVPDKLEQADKLADAAAKTGNGQPFSAANHLASVEEIIKAGLSPECPECGEAVEFVEGCVVCHGCGYSACG